MISFDDVEKLYIFCHGVSKTVFFEASGDVKNGPF